MTSTAESIATIADSTPRRRSRRGGADRRWVILFVAVDTVVIAVLWHSVFQPFWYDEAWRAYHLTLSSDFWSELRNANAPMAAGWMGIERLSTALFGNVEAALRLPEVLSLPVFSIATFSLARKWLPSAWAGATALLASVNASLLVYGLQLKAYLPEAACTSIAVLAWLTARQRRAERRSVWPWYLVLAGCVLVALPAVFVVGPLLLVDAIELLRAGDWRGFVAPVALGIAALAHLQFFVMRQAYLAHDPFWNDMMLGSEGKGSVAHRFWTAVVSLPAGAGSAALTSPNGRKGAPLSKSPLLDAPIAPVHILIGVGLVCAWALGVWACARGRDGRALLIALGGALALTTVAATLSRWPVGFVRTNLFLVPLLYVVAGIGVHAIVTHARQTGGATATLASAAAAIFAVSLAGTAVWRLGQLHGHQYRPTQLTEMRAIVADEGKTAVPGDVFVFLTARRDATMWVKPHAYYATLADDTKFSFAVPKANELPLYLWDSDAFRAFVADHPDTQHIFVQAYDSRKLPSPLPTVAGYCRTPIVMTSKAVATFRYDRC